MTTFTKIQHRRDTAANWTAANPVLNDGEIGFEHDTNRFKIGDGLTHWSALTYFFNSTDALAAIPDASTSAKGRTKLDVAPVSPSNPIAVGSNSTKVLTVLAADYSNDIPTAIAAIGSTPARLVISSNTTLSTPTTIPSTLRFDVQKGALITKSGTGAINFQGVGLVDPMSQDAVFSGFAPSDITWTGTAYPAKLSTSLWNNASWSDRVNAASLAMVGKSVTVVTYPDSAGWTGRITVKAGQSLYLTRGNYVDNSTSTDYRFVLESNTRLYGDGSGQTIYTESTTLSANRIIVSTGILAIGLDGFDEQITIKDFTIQGSLSTPHVDNGASAIQFGNGSNLRVTGMYFKNIPGYGVYAGLFPTQGYHANSVFITENVFDGVRGQNCGTINGENIVIAHNIFKNIQPVASDGFITVVDLEPNVAADLVNNVQVIDNVFDGRVAQQGWNAIVLQPGGDFNGVTGARVSGNLILGTTSGAGQMAAAITLSGARNGAVENNLIRNSGQSGIAIYTSRELYIRNNSMTQSGSGGTPAIQVGGLVDSYIEGNIVRNDPNLVGNSDRRIVEVEATWTVNTSGTAVSRTSGGGFFSWMVGESILINGVSYTISSVTDASNLVLGSSAGTQTDVSMSTVSTNTYAFNDVQSYSLSPMGTSAVKSAIDRVIVDSAVIPAIASNTNDFTPFASVRIAYRLDLSSSANVNITGMSTGGYFPYYYYVQNGQRHLLYNAGANNITLTNQDTNSQAANRFKTSTGLNIVLAPGQSAEIEYRASDSRWYAYRRVDATTATLTDAQTLTNKSITPRENPNVSSATPTPNANTDDVYTLTAQAVAATFGAPTGSPVSQQPLIVSITDNGTSQTLAWNAAYSTATGISLPTATTVGKTLYVTFRYNATSLKWDCVGVSLLTLPAGSTNQVQFNNAGAFGASSNFTYGANPNQLLLTAGNATDVPFAVKLAASAAGDAIQVNSSSGSGGDVFKIGADGAVTTSNAGGAGLITHHLGLIQFVDNGGGNNNSILSSRWSLALGAGGGGIVLNNKLTSYNGITTVGNGVPAEYATVDLIAQSAAIAATTLYAVPSTGAGMYRVSFVAKVTQAATTSSTLGGAGGLQITYTDANDSVVVTSGALTNLSSSSLTGNTTQTVYVGSFIVNAKASTNIQYALGYTSSGAASMAYNLHIKVEAL